MPSLIFAFIALLYLRCIDYEIIKQTYKVNNLFYKKSVPFYNFSNYTKHIITIKIVL